MKALNLFFWTASLAVATVACIAGFPDNAVFTEIIYFVMLAIIPAICITGILLNLPRLPRKRQHSS